MPFPAGVFYAVAAGARQKGEAGDGARGQGPAVRGTGKPAVRGTGKSINPKVRRLFAVSLFGIHAVKCNLNHEGRHGCNGDS